MPVCLVKNDDLVPSGRKGDFLLGKHLNLVPNNINASAEKCQDDAKQGQRGCAPFVGCIQLQHAILVGVSQELMCKAMYACSLTNPWKALQIK